MNLGDRKNVLSWKKKLVKTVGNYLIEKTKIMLYNQNNLNVAKMASVSDIKLALASVLFTKEKTVATDSFRLLEITTPKNLNVEDFPKVDGASAMRGFQPFMVSAKALKEIKIPKKAKLPIMESVAIKHVDNNRVEFLTTNGESADIKNIKRTNGQFPDYERIFPTEKPLAEVELNGELLAELLEVMSKLDVAQRVKIKVYAPNKPVVLEAGNDNQKGRGMVIPMNR